MGEGNATVRCFYLIWVENVFLMQFLSKNWLNRQVKILWKEKHKLFRDKVVRQMEPFILLNR